MPVNRQPIDGLPLFVGPVAVPHVMPMMHVFVECLGESKRDRFHHGKHSIHRTPTEIWVVDEVVRDPVNVPGDTNRVDDSHAHQHPPRRNRKERKKRQNVSKMQHPAQRRQGIPFRVGENLHTQWTHRVIQPHSPPEKDRSQDSGVRSQKPGVLASAF